MTRIHPHYPAPANMLATIICVMAGVPTTFADCPPRYPERTDIPPWWQQTRAFYCPLTNSGAGGSLMKYNADKRDNFSGFLDLPNMLDDAVQLGTNVIYLVDYWDPDYPHKSDYQPKAEWGGPAALAQGVAALHAQGGRIILYLEAFIIHRGTDLGQTCGQDWGMMQIDPTVETCDPRLPPPGCWGPYDPPYHEAPYFYWHPYLGYIYEYYLMYPGQGSGWTYYLVDLAGQMAQDYGIDGVHLDSYGVHQLVSDLHPDHPGGDDPANFQNAAVDLITQMRAEMRQYVPDAVVILEGASFQDMLEVCDGSQFESLDKLRTDIPYAWTEPRRYPIYTSSFDLPEMQEILDEGHNLALSPWWFDQGQDAVDAIQTMCVQATSDPDGDEVYGDGDNCALVYNPAQEDGDNDDIGDACDNCPSTPSADQTDSDSDGLGDVCDSCPNDAFNDADSDGICGDVDNCPQNFNPAQVDHDADGVGDVCDGQNGSLNPDDVRTEFAWDIINRGDSLTAGGFVDGEGNVGPVVSVITPSDDDTAMTLDTTAGGKLKWRFQDSPLDPAAAGMSAYMAFEPHAGLTVLTGNYTIWEFRGTGQKINLSACHNGDGTVTYLVSDHGAGGSQAEVEFTIQDGWTQLFANFDNATNQFNLYDVRNGSSTPLASFIAGEDTGTQFTLGNETSSKPTDYLMDELYIEIGSPIHVDDLFPADRDSDGVLNPADNCPWDPNPDQTDTDGDGVGDTCDGCPDTMPAWPVDEAGCPLPISCDLDHDGDVDQEDFGRFQVCLSGPGASQTDPDCQPTLLDRDSDVDQNDLEVFQSCMSGANVIADPLCRGT